MKVLVLGSGAREHAIAWKFSKSNILSGLYVAPGNAGTEEIAENLPDVDPCDSTSVISACRKYKIDFVFVGPEAPLAAGVVEVRHGRWEWDRRVEAYRCSSCQRHNADRTDYCPNCGAKMDGGQ